MFEIIGASLAGVGSAYRHRYSQMPEPDGITSARQLFAPTGSALELRYEAPVRHLDLSVPKVSGLMIVQNMVFVLLLQLDVFRRIQMEDPQTLGVS